MFYLDTVIVDNFEYDIFTLEEKTTKTSLEDIAKEIARLVSSMDKIEAKLSNKNFVERASPEIVEAEHKKWWDTVYRLIATESKFIKTYVYSYSIYFR